MTFFQPFKGGLRQGSKISKLKRSDLVFSGLVLFWPGLVLFGLVCSGLGLVWSWSLRVSVFCLSLGFGAVCGSQ